MASARKPGLIWPISSPKATRCDGAPVATLITAIEVRPARSINSNSFSKPQSCATPQDPASLPAMICTPILRLFGDWRRVGPEFVEDWIYRVVPSHFVGVIHLFPNGVREGARLHCAMLRHRTANGNQIDTEEEVLRLL